MAFVKIDKHSRGGSHATNEIRMGSHLKDNNAPRGVYISITRDVFTTLKWPIEEVDTRTRIAIDIAEGTEGDAGFLSLSVSSSSKATLFGTTKGAGTALVAIVAAARLKHYVLNDLTAPVEPVEFTIEEDNTILIQCPDWLRYNPESITKPPLPKPTAVVHLNRQERRAIASKVAQRYKR